ncbi:unnamed protein product [Paramecium sonneborni]|uniref:Uncharacterized protein n=1 Tax=Paramecium sonneborni TaxID=65129 RepID=A0A8S1RQV6_9CILI|nr:unnamed protein product [Paramecium sonneborni]
MDALKLEIYKRENQYLRKLRAYIIESGLAKVLSERKLILIWRLFEKSYIIQTKKRRATILTCFFKDLRVFTS